MIDITVLRVELSGTKDVTYNLTVNDFHTYYVTEYGVLVHNIDCDPRLFTRQSSNGLNYTSHEKHLSGGNSGGKLAGIEPDNALDLFGNSVQIGRKRYSIGSNGNIHMFNNSNSATGWHWSAGTADAKVPLQLHNKVKSALQKAFPEHRKNKFLK